MQCNQLLSNLFWEIGQMQSPTGSHLKKTRSTSQSPVLANLLVHIHSYWIINITQISHLYLPFSSSKIKHKTLVFQFKKVLNVTILMLLLVLVFNNCIYCIRNCHSMCTGDWKLLMVNLPGTLLQNTMHTHIHTL